MDHKDKEIIDLLQHHGKMSYSEIGEHVDLSITAVKERIKKLIESKVLSKNVYIVNPEALGIDICAFVRVLMPTPSEEANFMEQIMKIPEIQECHSITGEYSYMLKIRATNTRSLEDLMNERITSIKGVVKTNSAIALTTFKENTQVKIPLK